MMTDEIAAFVRESNRIEGIIIVTGEEVRATRAFLDVGSPGVDDVEKLVSVYQPDAVLRREPHLNVRVGRHIAPQGGKNIEADLDALLIDLDRVDVWETHVAYETLHPFTDGNGRSGRAIWAWQMQRQRGGFPLGFLHHFYYQTLERVGR